MARPSPHRSVPERDGLAALFPPFTLAVRAGNLVLRMLRDEDLPAYAALLREPIFEDESADHVFDWYAVPEQQRISNAVAFQWSLRTQIAPEAWTLPFGVFVDGRLVGMQDVRATRFALTREVDSGSWLTRSAQGNGYGSLMRRAMLILAIDHLGARRATSAAVLGNIPSLRVSRACGYRENGLETRVARGRAVVHQRFRLEAEDLVRRDVEVEVTGLTRELRALLGAE